jgi:FKBP-type peptidyl-prolyl cis-trans isomerase FkpA
MSLSMSSLLRLFALVTVAAAMASACVGSATPTRTPEYSQSDLRIGGGEEATAGLVATVNYTGWLHDPARPDSKGAVFDSSIGVNPFVFRLGAGGVIAGWDRGVPGMRVGGLRRLVIPPSLAYGAPRAGTLPPFATLVFEIELMSVAAQTNDQQP